MSISAGENPPVMDRVRDMPEATASRLHHYSRVLTELSGRAGPGPVASSTINSQDLAAAAGVDAAKLRRDLSFLGSHGVRGVGYDIVTLTDEISRALGAHTAHRVALVGLGNLGQALAGYSGFAGHGFALVALFDIDPQIVGRTDPATSLMVHDIADAATVLTDIRATIGIVTTPARAAQSAAERLIAAGIGSILNFAPCLLDVPDGVHVRQVDLGLELQMLAFHEARRVDAATSPATAVAR